MPLPSVNSARIKRYAATMSIYGVLAMTGQLLPANPAEAKEWLGLTGLEVGENNNAYAFAGALVPVAPDSSLGEGWVARYWLDWVEYRFTLDGNDVKANVPGFSASLGYQQKTTTGFIAAYAGAGIRNTTLSPPTQKADVRGLQTFLPILGELDSRFASDWRFAGAVQYSVGLGSYWSRFKILNKSASASVWKGIEVIFQGDADYRANKIGFVFDELPVGDRVSANFKLGASKTQGVKRGGYVGIEFIGRFGE